MPESTSWEGAKGWRNNCTYLGLTAGILLKGKKNIIETWKALLLSISIFCLTFIEQYRLTFRKSITDAFLKVYLFLHLKITYLGEAHQHFFTEQCWIIGSVAEVMRITITVNVNRLLKTHCLVNKSQNNFCANSENDIQTFW